MDKIVEVQRYVELNEREVLPQVDSNAAMLARTAHAEVASIIGTAPGAPSPFHVHVDVFLAVDTRLGQWELRLRNHVISMACIAIHTKGKTL